MNRRALALALAAVVLLSGCGGSARTAEREADTERYRICVEAGGTYTSDIYEQTYTCTMPTAPEETT